MNKKLKIGLGLFAGLAVAGTVGGVTAGVLLNQNQTTLKSNNVSSSIQNNTQTSTYSLESSFNKQTQQFNVVVKNGRNSLGILKLIDTSKLNSSKTGDITSEQLKGALVDTLQASAGQKVYVTVITEQGYEARNLKVWGDNPNIMLETHREDGAKPLTEQGYSAGIYSFTLPTNVTTNPDEENDGMDFKFPIDSKGTIHVDATIVKTQVAGWTWNYEYKSYVLNLENDAVLDDSNPLFNINKAVQNGDVETSKLDTIPFIIFLNGNDVKVKTFTIPSGVTLTFITNPQNTHSSDVQINLVDDKQCDNFGFILEGVIANYQGIKINAPIRTVSEWKQIYQNYKDGKYSWSYDWSKENK